MSKMTWIPISDPHGIRCSDRFLDMFETAPERQMWNDLAADVII